MYLFRSFGAKGYIVTLYAQWIEREWKWEYGREQETMMMHVSEYQPNVHNMYVELWKAYRMRSSDDIVHVPVPDWIAKL